MLSRAVKIYYSVGTDTPFYKWKCSALTASNHYILPSVSVADFGIDFVEDSLFSLLPSIAGYVYIYPIPSSINCTGRVSAVRYCYGDFNLENEPLVFTLLTLARNTESNFRITNVIKVLGGPDAQACRETDFVRYCCGSSRLMNQFRLPLTNFAFGVIPSSSVPLLGYNEDDYPQYLVQRSAIAIVPSTLEIGSTLDSFRFQSSIALRLFSFLISKLVNDLFSFTTHCPIIRC